MNNVPLTGIATDMMQSHAVDSMAATLAATNQVAAPVRQTAGPMQHGMDSASTQHAPIQVDNVTAPPLPDEQFAELPKTGDTTPNTRGPLMAMIVGAVLTAFGFRRQRKEK